MVYAIELQLFDVIRVSWHFSTERSKLDDFKTF